MVKLTDVAGIGPVAAKLLAEHNIKTVDALASISLTELQKISGFSGDIRARAVKKAASDCLKQSTVPAKPVKTVQTVKEAAGEKAKADQALSQIEANKVTDKKKDKKDDKKKEKVKDKDKKKKDKNKKSSKKKEKDKKKK